MTKFNHYDGECLPSLIVCSYARIGKITAIR